MLQSTFSKISFKTVSWTLDLRTEIVPLNLEVKSQFNTELGSSVNTTECKPLKMLRGQCRKFGALGNEGISTPANIYLGFKFISGAAKHL